MERRTIPFHELLKEPGYVYQVPDTTLATTVRISAEDNILVLAYRERHKKPRTTIIHLMIGQATKCWEEKHDAKMRELQELQERVTKAEFIMALYHKKYGPLHVRRNVRDSIIKPETQSLDKPGS